MSHLFFRIAAALCFLAVALGAFGAHRLKATLQAHEMVGVWEKAVFYHFLHAIAILDARAAWHQQPRTVFLISRRHTAVQRQPVRAGPNECSVARRHYSAWRTVFSRWLGVVSYRANDQSITAFATTAPLPPRALARSRKENVSREPICARTR